MAPTVRGLDQMTLVSTRKGWSKSGGETIIERWEGPLAKANVLYASLKLDTSVTDLSLDPDKPKAVLEVTKPDPDQQTTEADNAKWQLRKIRIVKDLRTHPYFTQSMVLATDIARCDKCIENGTSYNFAGAGIENVMRRYYAMRQAGVDSYTMWGRSLSKTVLVSSESAIVLSYATDNQVVTLASINPPSKLLGSLSKLPIVSYNGADPVANRTLTLGGWEWLCEGSECIGSGSKFELTTSWLGADKWSKVLYLGSWDPTV